jgi:hypothetical protein
VSIPLLWERQQAVACLLKFWFAKLIGGEIFRLTLHRTSCCFAVIDFRWKSKWNQASVNRRPWRQHPQPPLLSTYKLVIRASVSINIHRPPTGRGWKARGRQRNIDAFRIVRTGRCAW